MKIAFGTILAAALAVVFSILNLQPRSSALKLRDGYYTAEETGSYRGWTEFLTIYVSNGKIVTCEYNAKNASGFIKSWDMDYMRRMNETCENYPDKFTRNYVHALLANQTSSGIDAMSGATDSHKSFTTLAGAALASALGGDYEVVFVDVERE
ncbi:MAG: FMN-binding protein [Synergistaceae bacterium]|nr:FMN-binding protein [Synergistaceae bacterium]